MRLFGLQYERLSRQYGDALGNVAWLKFESKIGRKFVSVIAIKTYRKLKNGTVDTHTTRRTVLYVEISTGEMFVSTPSGARPIFARGNVHADGTRSRAAVVREIVARLL